ncbi:hypothetical protein KKA09_03660, partial [Patescibacteria group bacterium]|nr:hypothetical protein [Patescibacteria group bacterium]
KELFLNDLHITVQILKGNITEKDIKSEGENVLDIISPFDLKYLWFCPCTAIKLIGPVFQYFH